MSEATGRCLCGECVLTVHPGTQAHVCHCSKCRKWSGGINIAVEATQPVTFNDGAPVGIYGSSAWGERVFCRTCGSSLLWRSVDGAHSAVSLGVFDDPSAIAVTNEIFIDCKPDNYALAGNLTAMTEAEFMAQFAPPPEG